MSIFSKKEPVLTSDLVPEDALKEPTLADIVDDNNIEPLQPNLDNKKKNNVSKVLMGAIALVAMIILVTALMSLFKNNNTFETPAEEPPEMVRNTQPKRLVLERTQDPEPAPVVSPTTTEQVWQEAQQGNTIIVQNQANQPPPEPDRRLSGSVMIPIVGSSGSASAAGASSTSRETPLSNRLNPTVTASTKANQRADLTYLMKKGTNIACTLDTKIVTTHPGITRCLVTKDVYSANGKVLLVERGSEVIGEQTTAMLQGQAKVFVLWNTIDTPQGVTLDIASPSADALGASGQDAQVDRHFWERFGGAIMLSLIDDGLVIVGDRVNRGGSSVSYDSTSDTIENMAAEALKNTINIPPTGYVNQGTILNIMVARDVDFSPVYELVTPYFRK